MSTYVSAVLRKQVIERANNRCEYCRFPQGITLLAQPFQGDAGDCLRSFAVET